MLVPYSYHPNMLLLLQTPDPFEPPSFLYLLVTCPIKLLLRRAYHLLTYLRTAPTPLDPSIRIVCISDTHSLTSDVPPGDILIHAGDLTNDGSVASIQEQLNWLSSLPHTHKIVIAGNHDTFLDPRTRPSLLESDRTGHLDWKDVRYLQHSAITLSISLPPPPSPSSQPPSPSRTRHVRIYGAPQTPACGPSSTSAFQYPRGLDAWSETVPEDTSILVTHTPPKYHLDLPLPSGMGCEYLLAEVKRVKPALHVFGHIHWGAGQHICWWDGCQEAYERGMQRKLGWSRGFLDWRLWREVVRLVVYGLKGLVWDKVWGGQGRNTRLVNAAQMMGNSGKLGNPVQVVEI